MYDLNDIANKVAKNIPVTTAEYLYLLQNSNKALWGFLITNNPGNINNTLRHQLGYIELGFDPKPVAIAGQIEMMLRKGETEEINQVLENFVLNEEGLDPEFVEQFKIIFA